MPRVLIVHSGPTEDVPKNGIGGVLVILSGPPEADETEVKEKAVGQSAEGGDEGGFIIGNCVVIHVMAVSASNGNPPTAGDPDEGPSGGGITGILLLLNPDLPDMDQVLKDAPDVMHPEPAGGPADVDVSFEIIRIGDKDVRVDKIIIHGKQKHD